MKLTTSFFIFIFYLFSMRPSTLGSMEKIWRRTRPFILEQKDLLESTNALLLSQHLHGFSNKETTLHPYLVIGFHFLFFVLINYLSKMCYVFKFSKRERKALKILFLVMNTIIFCVLQIEINLTPSVLFSPLKLKQVIFRFPASYCGQS